MILAPHPTTFSLNLARSHIVSHHTTVQPCVPNWQSFGVLIIAFLKPSLLLHPHHRCQSLPPVCLQTSRSLARSSPAAAEISLWTVGQPQISVWWVDLAKQNRGISEYTGTSIGLCTGNQPQVWQLLETLYSTLRAQKRPWKTYLLCMELDQQDT